MDIIYAFDDNPEYFLIEFDGFGDVLYAHLIGYIGKDNYMIGLNGYISVAWIVAP